MTSAATSAADTAPQLRRMARGSGINLIGAVVAALANLALVVVLTHSLSKRDVGTFYTATSVFLLCGVLTKMGTQTGLVYFVSRLRSHGQPERIGYCLRVALRPVAGAGVLLGALLAVAGLVVHGADHDTAGRTLAVELWTLAPFVPAAALSDALLAASRGFNTMGPTVKIENLLRSSLQFALASAAAASTGSAVLLVLGWVSPYLVSSAVAAVKVRGLTAGAMRATGAPAVRQVDGFPREFWRFTAPRAFASVAQMLLQRLDIVLVAALRGPADAAVYTAATRLLVAGQMGGLAITGAAQPRLAATLSTGRYAEAREAYQVGTSWLVLLTWPFYLLSIVFAPLFLRVFGHGYTSATTVVVILAASMLVATGCGMVDMVLTMGGRTSWNLVNTVAALVTNVVVDVILVPQHGVTGAAIGWACAIAVNNLMPLGQIWRWMGLHPFGPTAVTAMLLSAVAFGGVAGAGTVVTGRSSLPPALVSAAVAGCLLLAGLWWQRQRLRLVELMPRRRPPRSAAPEQALPLS